jgi:hypothetical protein
LLLPTKRGVVQQIDLDQEDNQWIAVDNRAGEKLYVLSLKDDHDKCIQAIETQNKVTKEIA